MYCDKIYRDNIPGKQAASSMRKTASLLAVVAFPLVIAGILNASDFEKDIRNIETSIPAIKAAPLSLIAPELTEAQLVPDGNKWWSAMSSAHGAIMKAALNATDKGQFPDIGRFNAALLQGANDETGHPDKTANGGKPRDIWFGTGTETAGGVLLNYEQFKFSQAYAKLGLLCHLTQDQAVPAHAANILHGVSESFEGYAAKGNKVEIRAAADGSLEPYAYYQELQDATRRSLSSWVNPSTGKPYWVPAPDAPRLGQDATYGPRGSYGGGTDAYAARPVFQDENTSIVTDSPEIRSRQLAVSASGTMNVLASASKKLPPLVSGLALSAREARAGEVVTLSFTLQDNRSRKVIFMVSIYKDGELQGVIKKGEAGLAEPQSPDMMLNAKVFVALTIDGETLPAGRYVLDVRATDTDGNTTPDEVNSDGITANDTKAAFTVR